MVAHQRYTELLDREVYLETLQFNARTHYGILPGLRSAIYLTSLSEDELSRLIYADISVAGCGQEADVPHTLKIATTPRRSSATKFAASKRLSFAQAKEILSSALMRQPDREGLARMPYPSGGALYSVQTFLCRTSIRITDWPDAASALHVLPLARALESLNVDATPATLLEILSGESQKSLGEPDFALVYAMFIDKALFKYRYRGYRLALMEAGSMYQRVTQEVDARGFATRMWAAFSDYHVAAVLGLDATHMLPLVVQFIGSRD
ncbi:nitroreductase family protein [Cupriavidus basilensis]|uniref:Nitroreductase family protein n=1 Tax=Cupriavidus basilensis TaxID=68895 RepID=A0ABT6AQE2_9BURK|nr:nitroreductase family protein [Cupriavidus basilensis]MDF3834643.1 nitroreductase family protein [Cupriavidus basilensis]